MPIPNEALEAEVEETGEDMRDALNLAFAEDASESDDAGTTPATVKTGLEDNFDLDTPPLVEGETVDGQLLETADTADAVDSSLAGAPEKAPASWTPAAREHWAGLPNDLKATINKREKELQTTLNDTAQARQLSQNFGNLVSPYQGMFQAQGVDTFTGINNTLQLAAQLQMGTPIQKAQAAANIIKQFGVDISTLDDLIVGNMPAAQKANPQVDALQNQVMQMQQYIQQQQHTQQQTQNTQQNTINQETEQFMAQNEFANDLRGEMADFMDMAYRSGKQIDLKTAYQRAISARPDIQQLMSNRNNTQSSQQALAGAANAAVSVPQRGAGAAGAPSPTTMRGAIADAWENG